MSRGLAGNFEAAQDGILRLDVGKKFIASHSGGVLLHQPRRIENVVQISLLFRRYTP